MHRTSTRHTTWKKFYWDKITIKRFTPLPSKHVLFTSGFVLNTSRKMVFSNQRIHQRGGVKRQSTTSLVYSLVDPYHFSTSESHDKLEKDCLLFLDMVQGSFGFTFEILFFSNLTTVKYFISNPISFNVEQKLPRPLKKKGSQQMEQTQCKNNPIVQHQLRVPPCNT